MTNATWRMGARCPAGRSFGLASAHLSNVELVLLLQLVLLLLLFIACSGSDASDERK